MIYKECLKKKIYPSIWKRANVIPVHKQNSRQTKSNYRPISLLPIFGKVFEKFIVYCRLYNNDILTPHQSGFCLGHSTVNQLLAITRKIYWHQCSVLVVDGYESECKALLLCELALALTFLVNYVLVKKKKVSSVAVY